MTDQGSIHGSLRSADGTGVARIEARLEAGVDEVWSALTDPQRLAQWMGEVRGDLRQGGTFHARFLASEWEGTGRIETCEPSQRLLVSTMSADEPHDHTIEVVLAPDQNDTRLAWEERGMPTDQLAAYGAGVQIHVEDLAAHLAGRERCDAIARWRELIPGYRSLAVESAPS